MLCLFLVEFMKIIKCLHKNILIIFVKQVIDHCRIKYKNYKIHVMLLKNIAPARCECNHLISLLNDATQLYILLRA